MIRVPALALLLALLPSAAQAGTVTRDSAAITYTAAADAGAGERVQVGLDGSSAYVESERGADTADCTAVEPTRAECEPAPGFIVFLLGFDDTASAGTTVGSMTMEVHGGGGADGISGTPSKDRLFGDAGVDTMDGLAGDDLLEGGLDNDSLDGDEGHDTLRGGAGDDDLAGAGGDDDLDGGESQDSLDDGPGDDAVAGGSGNDSWRPGTGRDTFDAGDGTDLVDYSDRTAAVTITLAGGGADDGEAEEGDDLGTAAENARGGAGNDRIVGSATPNTLAGGGGNDQIVPGSGEDRVEAGEGDDTIDTRDGGYDSVDCGAGHDTVFADPGDGLTACEAMPDADGDGHPADADCAPHDPNVNPGASEVPGNDVDEDCKDGPLYLRVTSAVSYSTSKTRRGLRFRTFRIKELQPADVVELRCKGGRRRGCAFATRRYVAAGGQKTLDVVRAFRKRPLRRGATVEVRILRAGHIGKVQRLKVGRRLRLAKTSLCLFVGDPVPKACG